MVLVQGNNSLAALSKDKFLVMCIELGEDSNTSTQDISELWKVSTIRNTNISNGFNIENISQSFNVSRTLQAEISQSNSIA